MKRNAIGLLFLMAVLFIGVMALSGCSSTAPSTIPTSPAEVMKGELAGAPDWVLGCTKYFDGKDKKNICGVGSVSGTRNPSLARSSAVGRGRTEIARTLQTKVMAMLKDYQATTTGGQEFGTSAADEQHIVDVSKQITDMTLSGTEHVDSWVSNSGTFYALVVLDVEKFKDSINNMKTLSESVRKAVIERAEKSFGELDTEISKQRGEAK